MKKFKFRLQKLLQIKEHAKMQKQKELSRAERVRRMEEAHLEMLQQKMRDEVTNLAAGTTQLIDVRHRQRSTQFQQRLVANMKTQEQVIQAAVTKEAAKREDLIEATREEKTFEKLKERQKERYLKEIDLLTQKEIDEIAKNVYLRKRPA
jgi:flagellar FliJ protein